MAFILLYSQLGQVDKLTRQALLDPNQSKCPSIIVSLMIQIHIFESPNHVHAQCLNMYRLCYFHVILM